MSAMFLRCLERELKSKRQEIGRLVVELKDANGRLAKKAFEGRWLVGDAENSENFWFDYKKTGISEDGTHGGYSVAITKAGRIVVVCRNVSTHTNEDSFEVHDNFQAFSNATVSDGRYPMYPETLVQAVADELGEDYAEELNI